MTRKAESLTARSLRSVAFFDIFAYLRLTVRDFPMKDITNEAIHKSIVSNTPSYSLM